MLNLIIKDIIDYYKYKFKYFLQIRPVRTGAITWCLFFLPSRQLTFLHKSFVRGKN